MTAFNAVRFRVKPERDQDFLNAHDKIGATWPGLLHANIIKTGDRSYCIIAEWEDMDACIQARPNMIATLNSFRDTLEDLGGGLGVTDPVAGPVVLALKKFVDFRVGYHSFLFARLEYSTVSIRANMPPCSRRNTSLVSFEGTHFWTRTPTRSVQAWKRPAG